MEGPEDGPAREEDAVEAEHAADVVGVNGAHDAPEDDEAEPADTAETGGCSSSVSLAATDEAGVDSRDDDAERGIPVRLPLCMRSSGSCRAAGAGAREGPTPEALSGGPWRISCSRGRGIDGRRGRAAPSSLADACARGAAFSPRPFSGFGAAAAPCASELPHLTTSAMLEDAIVNSC